MHPRRFQSVFLAFLWLSVSTLGCGPTEAPEPSVSTYDATTFFATTSVMGASFSHDESQLLITTDASGIFNVYRQPATGGDWQQLTQSTTDATMAVSWFPEDNRFLFTADQGGNELNHLYVQELDGTTKDLTPGDNLKAAFGVWREERRIS